MIFLKLFFEFFKIGLFTFGGGYAMLPLIKDAALSNSWMTESQLLDFIAVSESTPGPFAVNMATYVGKTTAGFFGSVCATVGVVLPSFIVIVIIALCFARFKKSRTVEGVMTGLRPCAVGLIFAAALSLILSEFFGSASTLSELWDAMYSSLGAEALFTLAIFIASFVAVKKKINPIFVILCSAVLGIAFGFAVLD